MSTVKKRVNKIEQKFFIVKEVHVRLSMKINSNWKEICYRISFHMYL